MMSRQARILFPDSKPHQTHFRHYGANSQEARARTIVIALLIDGDTDDRELACLNTPSWLTEMGIDRHLFIQVLNEFCEDLAKIPQASYTYPLREQDLLTMLNEIDHPALQGKLQRGIRHLLESDGIVSRQEAQFWRKVTQAWSLPKAAPY